MTLITLQDGEVVLRAGRVGTEQACCCQCEPCALCSAPCLSVTFAGFGGDEEPCDECNHLDGTYVLTRGEGYQPEISLSVKAKTGSGAVLTPTIGYDNADGSYSITGVTIDKAGTCYSPDASVVVKILGGFVACGDDPLFAVTVDREEPLLDLSDIDDNIPPAGTGAVLTPVYVPAVTTPGAETWSIDSVTVTSSGSDYDQLATVFVKTKGCTVTVSPASLRVRTVATIPVQDATFIETKAGSGATVSVTWSPRSLPSFPAPGHLDGIPHWDPVVSASGGTGYAVNDNVKVTLSAEHYSGSGSLSQRAGSWIVGGVTAVDGSGAITGVSSIAFPYYRSDGSIDSVEVLDGGEYYTPGGIESVEVLNPGTIWPNEACRYTLCEPTECTYGEPPETKCRKIEMLAASDGYHLTVSLSPDDSVVYEASLPPEGNKCTSLEFTTAAITSSACGTNGTVTVTGETCSGPPAEDSCCTPDRCPPMGLCPCPGSGLQPLFITNWPGELAVGPAQVSCADECQYGGGSVGSFPCAEAGECSWSVAVCAKISCATINEETGCGSDCELSAITVTVDTDQCACPDELPDTTSFIYFYCP